MIHFQEQTSNHHLVTIIIGKTDSIFRHLVGKENTKKKTTGFFVGWQDAMQ